MSNFWKQKVAQESAAGMNVESTEELTHEGSPFAVENGEVESLEKDGDALASDMEQLGKIGEHIESTDEMSQETFDAVEVAQESIRKRWGLSDAKVAQESLGGAADLRVVAQESNDSGKKTLWERFIAWLKEMANKLKERWIKFHNAGKSLSKRATAYGVKVKELGEKKTDKISGGWIAQLTVNNQFIGNKSNEISKQVNFAKKSQKAQKEILETVRQQLLAAFNLDKDKLVGFFNAGTAITKLNATMQKSLESSEIVGNKYVAALEEGGEFVYELRDREGGIQEEIEVPSLSVLTQVTSSLYSFGKDLEAQLLEFRKTNDLRLKIAGLEGKLDGTVSGLTRANDRESMKGLMDMAQKISTLTISRTNTISQAESYIWKNLGSGLDGYIKAAIGAYDKKKK